MMSNEEQRKSLKASYDGLREMLQAIQGEERTQRDSYKVMAEQLDAAPDHMKPVLARQCNEILYNIDKIVDDRNKMHTMVGKIADRIYKLR
jgi:hypothetical protein